MAYSILDGTGAVKYCFATGTGSNSGDPLISGTMGYGDAIANEGRVFRYCDAHTIANNSTSYHLLVTPANEHIELLNVSVSCNSSPLTVSIYEGTQTSNLGTLETIHNMNRRSLLTTGAAVYETPTVTANGALMFVDIIAGAKSVGGYGVSFSGRMVLKASTAYLFAIQNNSGASATVALTIEFGND